MILFFGTRVSYLNYSKMDMCGAADESVAIHRELKATKIRRTSISSSCILEKSDEDEIQ